MTADEFVAKNARLVYYVLRKHWPKYAADEDLRQIGRIALWRAFETFRDDGGAGLTSYAVTCIHNNIAAELRKYRQQPASLDAPIASKNEGMDDFSLGDLIPDPKAEIDLSAQNFEILLDRCSKRQRRIIGMRLSGLSQARIAKDLDLSQAMISRELSAVRKIWDRVM